MRAGTIQLTILEICEMAQLGFTKVR